MFVTVVTPPAPIVTLEEAKAHLRLDHSDDDAYVTGLVAAATAWIDGPGGWLGRALGLQTLELRQDAFLDRGRPLIELPYPPIVRVVSVKYLDDAGTEQTIADTVYELSSRGSVWLRLNQSWPSLPYRQEAVRIQYEAGYEDVPAPIRHAILLLVGQWFEFRENVSEKQVHAVPVAVESLLSPYRVWSV